MTLRRQIPRAPRRNRIRPSRLKAVFALVCFPIILISHPQRAFPQTRTPLHTAAQNGDMKEASRLLRERVNIEAVDSSGWTPLHTAVFWSKPELSALLLDAGARIDARTQAGSTPLVVSAIGNAISCAELLLKRGADPNTKDKSGATALHRAKSGAMVDLLIDFKAEIRAVNGDGYTPLHFSAKSGLDTLIQALVQRGASIEATGKQGDTPLHIAARFKQRDAVNALIKCGAYVNTQDRQRNTPLHFAVDSSFVEIVELLLHGGASYDVKNSDGKSPYDLAKQRKKPAVIQALDAFIHNSSGRLDFFLRASARNGDLAAVRRYIVLGANIDGVDESGKSALHHAAEANRTDVIAALLKEGAGIEVRDRAGRHALHCAIRSGTIDAVRSLLAAGAPVNEAVPTYGSPLALAVKSASSEMVRLLIMYGADVQRIEPGGKSAWQIARSRGDQNLMTFLSSEASLRQSFRHWNRDQIPCSSLKGGKVLAVSGYQRRDTVAVLWMVPTADAARLGRLPKIVSELSPRRRDIGTLIGSQLALRSEVGINTEWMIRPSVRAAGKDSDSLIIWIPFSLHSSDTLRYHVKLTTSSEGSGNPTKERAFLEDELLLFPMPYRLEVRDLSEKDGDNRNFRFSAQEFVKSLGAGRKLIQNRSIVEGGKWNALQKDVKSVWGEVQKGSLIWTITIDPPGRDVRFTPIFTMLDEGGDLLTFAAPPINVEGGGSRIWKVFKVILYLGLAIVGMLVLLAIIGAVFGGDKKTATPDVTPSALLLEASRQGDEAKLQTLIAGKCDLEVVGDDGKRPVHFAASSGNLKILKLLIEAGANPESRSAKNQSALHHAIFSDNPDCIEFLIDSGLSSNDRDDRGWTPLHLAALLGTSRALASLLKRGAQVDSVTPDNWTPLHLAAQHNHMADVKLLLEAHANPTLKQSEGKTALDLAIAKGFQDIVDLLKKHDADARSRLDAARAQIAAAVEKANREQVALARKIAEEKARKEEEERKKKEESAKQNLFDAIRQGDRARVKTLLDQFDLINFIDSDGNAPIHHAARFGQNQIIELLLKKGADLNHAGSGGDTPLHLAAFANHPDTCQLLLEAGAKKSVKNLERNTALHDAASRDALDSARVLIAHSAPIDARGRSDFTPLHTAVAADHSGIVELLLRNGAKVNAQDEQGRTPLHIAVERGRTGSLKLLAVAATTLDIHDKQGRTALELAIMKKDKHSIDILRAAKARLSLPPAPPKQTAVKAPIIATPPTAPPKTTPPSEPAPSPEVISALKSQMESLQKQVEELGGRDQREMEAIPRNWQYAVAAASTAEPAGEGREKNYVRRVRALAEKLREFGSREEMRSVARIVHLVPVDGAAELIEVHKLSSIEGEDVDAFKCDCSKNALLPPFTCLVESHEGDSDLPRTIYVHLPLGSFSRADNPRAYARLIDPKSLNLSETKSVLKPARLVQVDAKRRYLYRVEARLFFE